MDKFEEQVCHAFDQFLPLNAVVKANLIVRQPINKIRDKISFIASSQVYC